MRKNMFEKVLNDVSLDPRIQNGTFNIEEETHMDVLREYLINKGIEESAVVEFCNKVVEGKYPERQAYNAKGILVTFPTPEYKADAIKRGTHFEEDPTKRASNVFSDQPAATPPPAAEKEPAKAPAKAEPKTATKTTLPLSQADTAAPEAKPETPTVSAPQPTSEPEEPPVEPKEPPPPPVKSTAEKEADKKVIKNILKGDDYMLERFASFIAEHKSQLPGDLLELIDYRIR